MTAILNLYNTMVSCCTYMCILHIVIVMLMQLLAEHHVPVGNDGLNI